MLFSETAILILVPLPEHKVLLAAVTVFPIDAGLIETVTVNKQLEILPEGSVAE